MTDPVDRLNRALEGRYAIERKLGEGGMATVYLARDRRHERQVALKVLKPELAAVVGAERFLTEIKVTAGLQHPNILPLFDSGEADGFLFYVMPYVEGESLRERLDRERQLPVDEAVRIATAVAGALQAAHDQGVVHRDIKPANILLSAGQPLVADFGIALAVRAGGGARLTETGLSLGTPYYMSPEQATGDQQVGARSDIYSLGCVLYEMLVGDPPYTGSTAQAVLGQIISGRPVAPTEKRSTLPANVDATIRKALERVAADRFPTATDFAAALDNPAFRYGDTPGGIEAGAVRKWKAVAAVLAVVSIASLSYGVWGRSRGVDGGEVRRYVLASPTPDPADLSAVRISPDGSMTAFIYADPDNARAGAMNRRAIWLQGRDELTATLMQGTDGAVTLDFSPDGSHLAFIADSTLKTIAIAGGSALTLTDLPPSGSGLTWASDGYLYRALGSTGRGAVRVPEGGGVSQPLSMPDSFSSVLGITDVLPGGHVLVGTRVNGPSIDNSDIFTLDLETGEARVIDKGRDPAYAASGHLLWLNSQDQLMAARMDPGALETSGPAVPVAENVLRFSISNAGDMLYQSGTSFRITSELVWMDRDGTEEIIDWPFEPGTPPQTPVLSPDGTKLALVSRQDTFRIFVRDLPNGPNTPIASGESNQTYPGWTRDSRGLGFLSIGEDGLARLYRARVDGSGPPVPISRPFDSTADSVTLGFWSPDQATVVAGDALGLAALRPGPDAELERILDAGERYWTPTLSPDGRWVAYTRRVEDEYRVFVRPYPDVGTEQFPISDGAGYQPRWSSDGSRIFYVHAERGRMEIWSARVSAQAGFRVDSREALFNTAKNVTVIDPDIWLQDVNASSDRFIVSRTSLQQPTSTGLILVENFFTLLEERAGGG